MKLSPCTYILCVREVPGLGAYGHMLRTNFDGLRSVQFEVSDLLRRAVEKYRENEQR